MTQALLCAGTAPASPDRLSDADFARIARIVSAHTGIKLPSAKRVMLEGRLRKRVGSLGMPDMTHYCSFLFERNGLAQEFVHVVDAVTTNKTDFFREPDHFTALERRVVPDLLSRRRGEGRPLLKLWSAASSSGAEAYTIAMVMAEMAAQNKGLRFAVLGTDISTEMLVAGERAVYPADMVTPVPSELQKRYIMRSKVPALAGKVRIAPELRRLVRFQHLNLMDEAYPIDRNVDVIFLRNVLIYFEKATQEAVVSRLLGHLRHGGYLMLGHSESMIGTNLGLLQLAPAVFQRV